MTPRHPWLQLRLRFENRVDNRLGIFQAIWPNLGGQAKGPHNSRFLRHPIA